MKMAFVINSLDVFDLLILLLDKELLVWNFSAEFGFNGILLFPYSSSFIVILIKQAAFYSLKKCFILVNV